MVAAVMSCLLLLLHYSFVFDFNTGLTLLAVGSQVTFAIVVSLVFESVSFIVSTVCS